MQGGPKIASDGHDHLQGVWGASPDSVPFGYAHQAVNRIFREDRNLSRPSIQSLSLTFESPAEQVFFEGANGQGAFFYQSYPSNLAPKIIVSLGGRIYTIEIQGRNGTVKRLFDGNAREFQHAWFAQGYEYLLIQDGINPPIIWDGQTAARRSNIVTNEVPVGSCMAFIHGRFVVASADGKNDIRISEIVGATNVSNHADILKFPTVLPTFGIATNLGNIQALYAMPFLDSGTGQYELVAMCEQGFTGFDFSGTEEDLLVRGQVQKITLIGTGLVGTDAYAGLNGDVFFRSQDGISTYRNARVEYSQSWRNTPVSREVDYWIRYDRADLLGNIPMVSWQNMVFTGCSPLISPPSNPCLGYHKYCRGMVVFDAQSMSTAGRQGNPVWHGAWTGIRPWAFVHGIIGNADRCFAFSFDRDGKNRLYEISLTQKDDYFETEPRKIASYYTTGDFGAVEGRTSRFEPKKFVGGMVEMSDILDASEIRVQYRPDGAPCWTDVDIGTPGCDCPDYSQTSEQSCFATSWPAYARKNFPAIDLSKCTPGTNTPAAVFRHCQARVLMNGNMEIVRFMIQMELQPDAKIAECLGNNCRPIQCCPGEYDYSYHIAPLGSNPNVPALTCAPDVPTYNSSRVFTARCANSPSIVVTATGQATSLVSQQDADQKAFAQAQQNALTQLVCPSCEPATLADAVIDGGSIDYSAFFTSGQFINNVGDPFRLQDVTSDQSIAYGTVNDSGTLETAFVFPAYSGGSFNTTTNVYTDNGGSSARIQLQRACNTNGEIVWPEPGDYGV